MDLLDTIPVRLETPVDWWRETWIMRIAAVDQANATGSKHTHLRESDMSMLKNANAVLAGLHVIEAVTDAVAERHAKGEHFTFGDLASIVESNAVKAVNEAGIADHPWRHAPPKRGGRRPKGEGEGDAT